MGIGFRTHRQLIRFEAITISVAKPYTPSPYLFLPKIRRPHHDERPVEAGDGAADEDDVVFQIDLDDLQVANGHALGAVAAGQLLATLRSTAAAVAGDRGCRTRLAVDFLGAVGSRQAAETPSLDDACRPTALGGADDIDRLHVLEKIDGQLRADFRSCFAIEAELADEALWFDVGLFGDFLALPLLLALGFEGIGTWPRRRAWFLRGLSQPI